MEEHIFGTFSTDQLKFLHERTSALGVQHRVRTVPRDPSPGEAFTLMVTSGPDFPMQEMVAYYTTDGSEATEESDRLIFQPTRRYWSTAAWGYVTEWQVEMSGLPEGTLFRYRIGARSAAGTWHWADWPDPKRVVEEALVLDEAPPLQAEPGVGSTFARSIDHFAPPQWAQEAVVYQVFLDRFARENDEPWPAGISLLAIHGGTLRGTIQKLDHIARLGATCIWLSPLFPSPTHHGYDATDYYGVEPRLGSRADLKELVDRAHALDVRVMLDFVCNHVCDEHPFFQQALAEPTSELREWFGFDPGYAPHGYRTFFGVKSMPELNTDCPAVRDYLLDAATMWVREFDIDGFRLDYAHGPSHAFWAHFWRSLKQIKPDVWCFGEIVDTPDNQLSYLGYLDGVLDFQVEDMLRRVFAHGSRNLIQWDHFLRDHEAFFPPQSRFSRPAFLDNHDMDRFLFVAGGSVERLRLASLVLYTLPNPPILYYGTEVALEQQYDKGEWGLEVSREPMRWELVERRADLVAFFQQLGALRQQEPAMRPTFRETLHVTEDQYLGRHVREESVLFLALNRAEEAATIHHPTLQGTFYDLLTATRVTLDGSVDLGALEGRLLKRATK
ncbi:MAG: alpha-amylase family glycosyl hydrolase [Chloroflexota bacterium]|nr:alpha-amylase family glycosyl hydrolase [Chloroflexota bacterium]